ncbi:unnamed protein product [Taenia asiatica]|uniref:Cystine/glutamate transporter n=1 Tax=Taenia asiatica TaxID=60517 RepID=A0A0R3WBP2_TAEAS|nr:unnamed protein product [Taenia asiatica]
MGGVSREIEVPSLANGGKREVVKMAKDIGVLQAVSIIFGIIVGSGIFVSPVGVLRYSNSVGLSLVMWLVPGLFSMLGALVYAELGVRIQKSGGEYAYVLEAFGGLPAFIVMWITFVVVGGVSCAGNSIIFAQYMLQLVYPDCAIPEPVVSMIALCGVSKCYSVVVDPFSVDLCNKLLQGEMGDKGCCDLLMRQDYCFIADNRLWIVLSCNWPCGEFSQRVRGFECISRLSGTGVLSRLLGIFGNYLNFLVEEMKSPGRNLPLAITIALTLVTGLYMLTNVAYLAVLSPYEMLATGSGSSAVAVVFAKRAMPWISMLMPVFVGASVFGSINGLAMSISRLTYTGAREGHMPSILAMIHHCNLTPIPAILILLVLAVSYQFYSDLFALIELAGFAFAFIAALAVAALLYMRYREPNLKTSFQLPIVFPILFFGCDLLILVLTIYQQPRESLSNVILMLAAIPIYWFALGSDNGDEKGVVKMRKEIGVVQAVSIVFGVIVGSGIFVSPVGVLRYSNSVGLSLIMWIVPGLFSMLGALAYAELGVRIQKSGGEYAYILEAFGGLPAFIVMWITFFIIGGVGCAANSIVFAQYMLQPVYPDCAIPGPVVNMIALCGLMLIFAINCYKVRWATRLAVIFTFGKILALLLIISFGLYYLATGHVESFNNAFEGSNVSPGYLALAFYQGFWAFGGNLPLTIGIALSLVTGLYVLTNVAYMAVLSPYEMLATGSGSSAIAVVFAKRAMPWIAMLMPVFVGASVFGSINGQALSISRLTYTGAREGHLPSILAMIHHHNLTPIPAILVLVSCLFIKIVVKFLRYLNVLILAVSYQFYSDLFALIELAGFAFSSIAALAVAALLYLRYKQPNLKTSFQPIVVEVHGTLVKRCFLRAFLCFGFMQLPIFLPILFLACDLFILALTVYQQPRESLSNVILMLAAIPIYWLGVSWKNKPKSFKHFVCELP